MSDENAELPKRVDELSKRIDELSKPVAGKMINLRLLHLRECAQIWSESANIESFIEMCNTHTLNSAGKLIKLTDTDDKSECIDFRYQNPLDTEIFGSKFEGQYWVDYMIAAGPKDPTKVVSKKNHYMFWQEGIAPYYNPASSSAMVQPYINNRLIIKVPKKQTLNTISGQRINKGKESLSGFEQTIALSVAAGNYPSFFTTCSEGDKSVTYESGAQSMGDLALSENKFNIETDLFIAHTGLYSLYFSKAYAKFRHNVGLPPLDRHEPTQLIPELLAPGQPQRSYNLNNDADGLYFGLSAGVRNLVTMMWAENNLWDLLITKPEQLDQHKPGQTVKLVNELLDTTYPLHFDLILMEDEHAVYAFDEDDRTEGRWYWVYEQELTSSFDGESQKDVEPNVPYLRPKLPLQIVQYSIPHPPENEGMAPIALMNYDVDDEGFPFTC
ncbi:hypothetical protein [Photobacterium satsumensis]|uniref:hypothetical protein n=1 Tax=Photobacterium satsumensis TaxID=2910239 RepID=UPI003D0E0636